MSPLSFGHASGCDVHFNPAKGCNCAVGFAEKQLRKINEYEVAVAILKAQADAALPADSPLKPTIDMLASMKR